jgi:hypothetical protein
MRRDPQSGQVAQVVERSPEKAGVGGSTPSLATINPYNFHQKSVPASSLIRRGVSPTPYFGLRTVADSGDENSESGKQILRYIAEETSKLGATVSHAL